MKYNQNAAEDTELIFGIVGPIGCNRDLVCNNLTNIAKKFRYKIIRIKISDIIQKVAQIAPDEQDQYARVTELMNAGNDLREQDQAILAKHAAVQIFKERKKQKTKRLIYLIDSLKHKKEIDELRNIYGKGFYLFAIHSSEESRNNFLEQTCNVLDKDKRAELINRDKGADGDKHDQNTSEAFHLADFFVTENGNSPKIYNALLRYMDIIFADPFRTPTFHEYAMFTAHNSAMRSADMSRQVGAVIAKGTDIISTGANECPKAGGGTYWPLFDEHRNTIYDIEGGRDYTLEFDFNTREKNYLIDKITKGVADTVKQAPFPKKLHPKNELKKYIAALSAKVEEVLERNIKSSGLNDITEYGRVVHAEMDAILACARRGIGCAGSVLFCTTFPCHNCAKHIVASGIKCVIYIEPYPKSKAIEMHPDSISVKDGGESGKVNFVPFVGVGPRQFVNLFSMSLSTGAKIERKDSKSGKKKAFDRLRAHPRMKMTGLNHLEIEEHLKSLLGTKKSK